MAKSSEETLQPLLGSAEQALLLLRRMQLIRVFEEQVRNLFAGGVVPGLVHLCSGQEAVAVGVCTLLQTSDSIASNHRGHGHCLAKGADPTTLLTELLGRRSSYGLGRSGSLHLYDHANGNLGTNGIVGGGIPLAVGAAFSAKRQRRSNVAVCFFGDGALNQGLLFEVMNMAAIWRLPALFVCENNGYGEFTASEDVTAGNNPITRGTTFDIPSALVDGMDVLAVREAAAHAIARARLGYGPSFLICTTYRYGGHHVGDNQSYKDDDEARKWRDLDPILRLSARLIAEGVSTSEKITAQQEEVEAEVRAAVNAAKAAPAPTAEDLRKHLHA